MIGVFGANGFIGKHLTNHLLELGLDVTAVARRFDPGAFSGARTIRADLTDTDAMRDALDGMHTVVQLMGTSTPAQGNADSTRHIRDDVVPHVEFLNLCVSTGVKRFIFASSGGTVYGPTSPYVATHESQQTNPISSHGVTKLTVENFIKLHGHLDGLEYAILRLANPYGPGQVFRGGQGLIPLLMERWRTDEPVTIYGDGRAARDYVYIDDVVRAMHSAIVRAAPPALVVNIGSGERRTVLDVVRSMQEILGAHFKLEFSPARQADVSSIALDISRARDELGWEPEVAFHDGLGRTIASAAHSASSLAQS